jgi:hypothetical protein
MDLAPDDIFQIQTPPVDNWQTTLIAEEMILAPPSWHGNGNLPPFDTLTHIAKTLELLGDFFVAPS